MTYNVHAIDLERFADCLEADVIMRLMWGINEMNQLAHLGHLIDKDKDVYPELWKYHEGITGSLIRQRSARVTEILETIVRPLVADNASTEHPEIYALIDSDTQLKDIRKELRELFYDGPDEGGKNELSKHRGIRHRIVDHFDYKKKYAVIPEALRLTALQALRDEDGHKKGWLIYGIDKNNKYIQRFLVADQVLNTAWRELILEIPLKQEDQAKWAEAEQAKEFTFDFMRSFHTFASRLIDLYINKNHLWINNPNAADLLTPVNPHSPLPEHIAQLDSHSLGEVTGYIGDTKLLVDRASDLYELFLNYIVNSPNFPTIFDINQRTAIFDCLQALRYNLVMSGTMIFRGHVTDTTNYSRRSIEIGAFLIEICSDTDSARKWIEMGKSGSATKRYKHAFPAHTLVDKHQNVLSDEIKDLYDNYCLFVHPSSASMHFQINVENNEHKFHYFEFQSDKQKANLLMQYFNLLNTYILLIRGLALFFDKQDLGFPSEQWQKEILQCATEIESHKAKWKSVMSSLVTSAK